VDAKEFIQSVQTPQLFAGETLGPFQGGEVDRGQFLGLSCQFFQIATLVSHQALKIVRVVGIQLAGVLFFFHCIKTVILLMSHWGNWPVPFPRPISLAAGGYPPLAVGLNMLSCVSKRLRGTKDILSRSVFSSFIRLKVYLLKFPLRMKKLYFGTK